MGVIVDRLVGMRPVGVHSGKGFGYSPAALPLPPHTDTEHSPSNSTGPPGPQSLSAVGLTMGCPGSPDPRELSGGGNFSDAGLS